MGFVALLAAVATAIIIWALHAPRFFAFNAESYGGFWNRRFWMLAHVGGGTVPLFLGPFLLWSGLKRWNIHLHRWAGRAYLSFGALSVGAASILSVKATFEPRSLYVSTFTLALAWFIAAGMALRAVLNKRLDAHREWTIRSYVLTWTFVGCRMAMRIPAIEAMGGEAITATVWVSWIMPLLLAEVAIQWRKTGAARH